MRMISAIVTLVCAATTGWADVTSPSGKTVDCYCTDKTGNRVELGEMICLQVDGRMFMAQCQMSLNVPMWREVQEGCLITRLEVDPSDRLPISHAGQDANQFE